MIPEDWDEMEYTRIGDIIDGDRGVNYPSSGDFQNSGHCLFLNAGNVTKTGFQFEDCQFISADRDGKLNKGKLSRQDVVLTTRGTLGNLAYFSEEVSYDHIRINSGMVIMRSTSSTVDHAYHYFVLRSRIVGSQIERLSFGSAQPQLTVKGIETLKIPLPPTKAEQEAIAKALTDADALIELLEQLLIKKRQIKKGAMQALLTGKKRLPGFSEEWDVKRLGEVLRFQVGCPFSSVYFNEAEQGIRLVKNRDLKNDDQVMYYSGGFAQEFLVRDGDLLIGMDGDFLPCMWAKGPALLNQRVGRILAHTSMDLAFAFYYLLAPLKEIESATSGTTVKHPSHGDIEGIEKPLPTLPEQTAIATVLSDMDAEITAFEAKLSKAHLIKQGMMQELLTGRIRLL